MCSDMFLLAPGSPPGTLSDWTCDRFTFFWCSQNFLASRPFISPHLSVIHIRGKRVVVVVDCGPRLLVSKESTSQRKQKLCFPCRTAKWLSWAILLIRSVTCFISLPYNYLQREKLPLHIFTLINQAWGLGRERLNSCSLFPAKMLQSTGDKINSFLLSENPKLFINKDKKVPDLSPSHLVDVSVWRVLILLLTLLSPFPRNIFYKSALESSSFWNQVWQKTLYFKCLLI